MNSEQTANRSIETIAWSAFFIWWGITELFTSLPRGLGAVGYGLILLGLNAARSLKGVPTSGLTIALGIVALVVGGLLLVRSALPLPLELPVFSIFLIVLGLVLLVRQLLRSGKG